MVVQWLEPSVTIIENSGSIPEISEH
jgi:hypothetical protein